MAWDKKKMVRLISCRGHVTTAGHWGNDKKFWLSTGCIILSTVLKRTMVRAMSSKKVRRAFIKYGLGF